jgi:hypothetical protein
MFHADYAHTGKGVVKYKDRSGNTKTKKAPSCVNRFRYITRTAQYENHKDHAEKVEYVSSGNMPSFCKDRPDKFWESAELYERKNGRTSTSLVIALPKELTPEQRIELTEKIIKHLCEEYNFPYTAAIHNHKGAIAGEDQPHLHLMYSERSVDEYDRTAKQFFSRYNDKSPASGGARKVTANLKGEGKEIVNQIRAEIEVLTNEALEQYAPTKIVTIKGIEVEVPNVVSCLHHKDYNAIHGTDLKAVPMMTKEMLRLDPNLTFDDEEKNSAHKAKLAERDAMIQKIQDIREHNNFELYEPYYNLALQKQNEAKKQQQQDIERVSASDLAYRLDLITYQATADKVQQIRQLSALQDDSDFNYIEAIERKASLLNDVLLKENRTEVSALVCEIYKHDLDTIREHSSSESMSYDEKRISERLNERISNLDRVLDKNSSTEKKVENTQKYDDSDNTFRP